MNQSNDSFIKVSENEPTGIFIINLKTGEVTEMEGETFFSQHHINAYETGENEIILDMSPSDEMSLK